MDKRTAWSLALLAALLLGVSVLLCGGSYWAYRLLNQAAEEMGTPAALATALPTLPPLAETAPPPALGTTAALSTRLAQLYRQAAPGVVSILTYGEESGQGSGFVYDRNGHIVTNYHVVEGAEKFEVDFLTGTKVWAHLTGTDPDSDIAVLKVDVPDEELHPLPLGDSDALQVGEMVVAIGNPFGLRGTMTFGIVSAKGRTLASEHESNMGGYFSTGDIIQTDAPINPGNSGGPLLNLQGEVVGINRAIRTTGISMLGEPVNSGIGFAVPVNIVKRVVPVLISGRSYEYPYLGISGLAQLNLEEVERLGLPQTTGVYIVSVAPNSPAAKAGLRGAMEHPEPFGEAPPGGDLIVAVDGQPVRDFGDLMYYLMYTKRPGDKVMFTVLRNGQEVQIEVTLGRRE